MSLRESVLATYRSHLNRATARLAEFMHAELEVRAAGAHVWDDRGNRYLECGGYGVFILGHCHPHVVEAVVEQVRSHPLSTRMLLNPAMARAAETLVRVAPVGLDQVQFTVSGADAVESALKLARANGRRRVIATDTGYHGKSLGALSVMGSESQRQPFLPLLENVDLVPFGDLEALRNALEAGPPAGVILEPVQGEAGVRIPPPGYLKGVESTCREHGAVLVLDEIQTGLGRLGAWWGADRDDVVPDLLLVGKGLSGGVIPVSAVVGSEAIFAVASRDPAMLSSTFSGAPVAMAAARAAIEALEQEKVVERAGRLGRQIRDGVAEKLQDACPGLVREVRGEGLLIGIDWAADYLAFDFMIEMLDRRVILSHSLNAATVTRLTPPVLLADDDVEWLMSAVTGAGRALASRSA